MWSVMLSLVAEGCVHVEECESTPPCGTPDLNWRFVDEWFLNVVYAMRTLM